MSKQEKETIWFYDLIKKLLIFLLSIKFFFFFKVIFITDTCHDRGHTV